MAGFSDWFGKTKTFLQEVVAELKRTTWPKFSEVKGTTTVVLLAIFVFALFLFLVDSCLAFLYQRTTGLFR